MYLPANCFPKFFTTAPTRSAKRSSSNFPLTTFRFHSKDSYPFASSNKLQLQQRENNYLRSINTNKNTTHKDRLGARSFHYEAQHATNVQTTTTVISPPQVPTSATRDGPYSPPVFLSFSSHYLILISIS
jgi:hypothetical protein